METPKVKAELEAVCQDFGARPYGFFSILDDSDNPNLNLRKQNIGWDFIKSERWHSLDLSSYILWSISDNGDLLWWNGEQTIAMNPRDGTYLSEPVSPRGFIRLVGLNKVGRLFPDF